MHLTWAGCPFRMNAVVKRLGFNLLTDWEMENWKEDMWQTKRPTVSNLIKSCVKYASGAKEMAKKDSLTISNTFKVYTHTHIQYHHTSSGALFSRDTTVAYFFLLEDMHVSFRANNVLNCKRFRLVSQMPCTGTLTWGMRMNRTCDCTMYGFLVYVCASEWNVCSWSCIYKIV